MKNWIILIFSTIFISNAVNAQCVEDFSLAYEISIKDENILKSNLEIQIDKNNILNLYGSNVNIETTIISCQGSYFYYSLKNSRVDKINIELIQEKNDICEFLIISRIFLDNKKLDIYKKYFFVEKIDVSIVEENYYLDLFKDKNETEITYSNMDQNEEEH